MGEGWRDGLELKFGAGNIEINLESSIKYTDGNDASDIDIAIKLKHPISSIADLFPTEKLQIRPLETNLASVGKTFLGEIKRSMGETHKNKEKIVKFVDFYSGLLSPSRMVKRSNRERAKKLEIITDPFLRDIINNKQTTLLFVFNGMDSAEVVKLMRERIESKTNVKMSARGDLFIHERKVLCIWCNSANMIKWKESLLAEKSAQMIARQQQENLLQQQEIARLHRELANLQRSTSATIDSSFSSSSERVNLAVSSELQSKRSIVDVESSNTCSNPTTRKRPKMRN